MFRVPIQNRLLIVLNFYVSHQNYNQYGYGKIVIVSGSDTPSVFWTTQLLHGTGFTSDIVAYGLKRTGDGDKYQDIWVKDVGTNIYVEIDRIFAGNIEYDVSRIINTYSTTDPYESIPTGDYDAIVYGTLP